MGGWEEGGFRSYNFHRPVHPTLVFTRIERRVQQTIYQGSWNVWNVFI